MNNWGSEGALPLLAPCQQTHWTRGRANNRGAQHVFYCRVTATSEWTRYLLKQPANVALDSGATCHSSIITPTVDDKLKSSPKCLARFGADKNQNNVNMRHSISKRYGRGRVVKAID